jgi:acetylornithine deacetylase/succinyl-diaminopimelate desuccinylase-like protein
MIKKCIFLFIFHLILVVGYGQKMSSSEIQNMAETSLSEAVDNLISFLKLPNDGHLEEQVTQNLNWVETIFKDLDFNTQIITTKGAPLLFAEKKYSGNKKTILFYLQIDGQPVDQKEWDQENAFIPVIKKQDEKGVWQALNWEQSKRAIDPDWRIFGRSASDSKGPAMAFITALNILTSQKQHPDFNIKVIMDFQEEMGSPHLADAVDKNRSLLDADLLLIMDGTRHLSNWPTLTYGARGIATATLRIFGPSVPLHSGQYGNFAPNPVFEASRLIASLKDETGRVLIEGFYEGVFLSEKEKEQLNSLPENQDSLLTRLGIATYDVVGSTYQEALQYPSLNIRGLKAAWVGNEVRTIIPDEVRVEIDMRLVPETPGERQMNLLKQHIKKQGYHLVDQEPNELERQSYPKLASLSYRIGSLPFRTPMNSKTGDFLNNAMRPIFGEKVVNMRTTGGSQPIAPFVHTLGVPAVSIRIPNPDNNIHAPNENLRLGNFMEGIMMCLAILNETPE